jgi:lysophospholipase L1-like esterase
LIVMAPLTLALVLYTLLHKPSLPVSAGLATSTQMTMQPSQAPSVSPTPSATAGAARPVAVFLGDSYASGTGASRPSKRWVDLVSLDKGWVEKNLSQDSSSYSSEAGGTSYRARMAAVAATGAQIVVVSGGRNDVNGDPAQLRADVRATFVGIQTALPKARIFVVSPTWGNDPAPQGLTNVISIVMAEAKRTGVTYLDIGQPMFGDSSMMAVDGWHPNDAGHAAIAKAVEKALTQAQ